MSCEDVLKTKKESQPEGIDITTSKIEYLITKSLSLIPFNIIVRPSIKSMMQTLNLGIGLANIENL